MVNEEFPIYCRDPELESLQRFSVSTLHSELSRHVPSSITDRPLSSYGIRTLRYTPRQKLVLGLQAEGGTIPIAIRVFPRDKVADRFESAQRLHPDHVFLLTGLDAIAWVFPGERKLDLDLIADRDRVAAIIREHRGYELSRLDLVHCVPEHTYTARAHGTRSDGTDACDYLKVYYNGQGAKTARLMEELAAGNHDRQIRFPQDVTYLPSYRLLIQPALPRDPGRRLSDVEVADALARIHRLSVNAPAMDDPDPEREFETVRSLVADTFPELMGSLTRINAEIHSAMNDTDSSPAVLLHGDAHLGNLFPLHDGGIGVIDLDRMRHGPPEDDIASFFAFRIWLELRNQGSVDAVIEDFPKFLSVYNRRAPHPVADRIAWLMLAHKMVLERVRRGVARGKFSNGTEIVDFARIACRCLEAGRRSRA